MYDGIEGVCMCVPPTKCLPPPINICFLDIPTYLEIILLSIERMALANSSW